MSLPETATSPAARLSLTDLAISRIKDMIVRGDLRPGDRLPREADLAENLGLSRSSLREAVSALSLINVLTVRQGAGTYVTSLEPGLLMDAITFVLDFHRDESVLQVLEVRRELEPAAAALAATRMQPDAIEQLTVTLASVDECSSVEEFVAADIQFHRLVAAGSGNPVLAALLDSLAAPTQRARIWRGITQESAVDKSMLEHEGILDAIRSGNSELARARATVHIARVEDWLRTAQR
jgi:DNA-binding FadR family transcriptional regulator